MSDSGHSMSDSERYYPVDADIRIAAKKQSERYQVNTPHGSIMSVPAMNEEQAKKLASDEFPNTDPSDFGIAQTCQHGNALRQSCLRCGREWGDDDHTRQTATER